MLDIDWCPHNDNVIASASEDTTVMVWGPGAELRASHGVGGLGGNGEHGLRGRYWRGGEGAVGGDKVDFGG